MSDNTTKNKVNDGIPDESILDEGIFPSNFKPKSLTEALEMIMKMGSTTFYNSAKFFPKEIIEQILILYAFVRIADNYVDVDSSIESRTKHLDEFVNLFNAIYLDPEYVPQSNVGIYIVKPFVELVKSKNIDINYISAFLNSMYMDLNNKVYTTMEETLEYIYGSAEVIGLMIASILDLNEDAQEYAKILGRAFQFINMIRDMFEDYRELDGRTYIPLEDLEKFGLEELSPEEIAKKPKEFSNFVHYEINKYREWQNIAKKGYPYLPRKARAAIMTATRMYEYTALLIDNNPQILLNEKTVKPSKKLIKLVGFINALLVHFSTEL